MKHVRFIDPAGTVRDGEFVDGAITFAGETYPPGDVELLPPVEPTKIICVGLNYRSHAEEVDAEPPERPVLFFKPPHTLAAPGETITLPAGKERVDYEAELGVVMDRQCRNVDADDAMGAVRGFTCVNDLSNRDDQRQERNWVRSKAFDNAAPVGPVVATPDELPPTPTVRLRLNGEVEQEATTDEFFFTIPELIAEITELITLEPGDVISTGTPAGIGPLEDGDTVDVEVDGVGTLRNDIEVVDADGPDEE
jgi:2-keto-4-pentenoate hydratase/2-oxohepta-3-ene-1,7-dioic acid hydratase in catechol pathway